MNEILNYFLHLDVYLASMIHFFGPRIYAILFGVIFFECGCILVPFLPGESLLFTLGALAAKGMVSLPLTITILCLAAILGGFTNYMIGASLRKYSFKTPGSKIHAYLQRTHDFYEKYGEKTIFIARLVPIVRTYAPFVAGLGRMTFYRFAIANIASGFLWISTFLIISYYFSNLPFIQSHFSWLIISIITLSVLPIIYEWLKLTIKK